jgi:hypothetical protein
LVFRVTSNKDLAGEDNVKQTKERRWLWEKANLKHLWKKQSVKINNSPGATTAARKFSWRMRFTVVFYPRF